MDIRAVLQGNCDKLLHQYQEHIQDVLDLQAIFIDDILPSLADELGLDSEAYEWAKLWLKDSSALFHIFRRNNFTRSAAMEYIRKTLEWRHKHLWPSHREPAASPALHCLPVDVQDPFGRPILCVRASNFVDASDSLQDSVTSSIETLRMHLKSLKDASEHGAAAPPLQYAVLLDLQGLSMQSMSTDTVTWLVRKIVPRFPGMLAGVFMINYTWAQSGIWSIAKRLLPEAALSRVFFPSTSDLIDFFTVDALPKDYGGALPFLDHLDDPLSALGRGRRKKQHREIQQTDLEESNSFYTNGSARPGETSSANLAIATLPARSHASTKSSEASTTALSPFSFLSPRKVQRPPTGSEIPVCSHRQPSTATIPAISRLNPFFGYPVEIASAPLPTRMPHQQVGSQNMSHVTDTRRGFPIALHHGRRRKRDLIRTLALLYWLRWRRWIQGAVLLLLAAAVARVVGVRRARRWFLSGIPAFRHVQG